MKLKNKLLTGVLATSALASTSLAAISLSSCGNTKEPEIIESKYFDIENGVLKGFKSTLTEAEKKEACKDGKLRLPAVKVIGANAFSSLAGLSVPYATEIVIDNATESIEDRAFYGNTASTISWNSSAEYPTSKLTMIGKEAFAFCTSLTSFKFPVGLFTDETDKGIGEAAFFCCENLRELDLTAFEHNYIQKPTWTRGAFKGLPTTGDCRVIFAKPTGTEEEQLFKKYLCAHMYTRLNYDGMGTNWKEYWSGESQPWDPQIKAVPEEYLDIDDNGVLSGATSEWPDEERGYNTVLVPHSVTSLHADIKDFFTEKSHTYAQPTGGIECWLFNWSQIQAIPDNAFQNIKVVSATDYVEAYWPDEYNDASYPELARPGLKTIGDYAFGGNEWVHHIPEQSKITSIGQYAFQQSAFTEWTFGTATTTVAEHAFENANLITKLDFSALTDAPAWTGSIFLGCGSMTYLGEPNKAVIKSYDNKVDQWRIRKEFQTYLGDRGLTLGTTQNTFAFQPSGAMTLNDIWRFSPNSSNYQIDGWAKGDQRESGAELSKEEVGQILDEIEPGVAEHTLTLPSTYNGRPVTMVNSDAFAGKLPGNVTKIIIPSSVTLIGGRTFQNNTSLKEVVIPNSVGNIGVSAFDGCTNLATIDMSSFTNCTVDWKLGWTGANIFTNIASTGQIKVHDFNGTSPSGITNVDQWRLNYGIKRILSTKGISFTNWTFDHADDAKLVTIDDNKVVTGWATGTAGALSDTEKVNLANDKYSAPTLMIPKEATSIAANAFTTTAGVSTIPSGLTKIAFESGGTGVTTIGQKAFYANPCAEVDFSNAPLTTVSAYAFANSSIAAIKNLPATLTSIEKYGFFNTQITELVVPQFTNAITFGIGAFGDNTKLATINMKAYGIEAPNNWSGDNIFDGIAETAGCKILVNYINDTMINFLAGKSDTIKLYYKTNWTEATA